MSTLSEFYVPDDEILRGLGRLQIVHSHLDHTLRLAIKRLIGISINNPGYWNETRGMTSQLRDSVKKLIVERYRNDQSAKESLVKILDEAEKATELRNRILHSVWMKAPGSEPILYDRDKELNRHISYKSPSADELSNLCEKIISIQRDLNKITRKLLSI